VGDGSDRWAPPGSDSRAQDPLVSGRREGGRDAGAGEEGGDWAAASGLTEK